LTLTDDDRQTAGSAVTDLPDSVDIVTEEGRRLAQQLVDTREHHARKLLEVRNLSTQFFTKEGVVHAVDEVSFELDYGETLGLVGESGCGKSVTALSLTRLVPSPPGKIVSGEIIFDGIDLMRLSKEEMRLLRGKKIGFIFQDPMTSLNPTLTIGYQIAESARIHMGLSRRAADDRAVELLGKVGIPRARERMGDYPHQFSGGMRQRVMIAIALACNPDLLIADEPTTALDVTIQAQILTLIDRLKVEFGSAVIVITHDMGVVAQIAETVAVMYAGQIVEQGGVEAVFASPQHPYAWGLLGSIPRLDRPKPGRLPTIRGLPPSLIDLPAGCAFMPRCDHAHDACRVRPELLPRSDPRHLDRCVLSPEAKRARRAADLQTGAA
jgi:oligopeptide transport system ATP-binding protein